jgi:hypothetical protein
MTIPTYIAFRDQTLAAGYDEVLEHAWAPGAVVHTHTHPFEANAVVVAGEMWLNVRDAPAQHLLPGDHFHLQANEHHEERSGAMGATYWVARKAG